MMSDRLLVFATHPVQYHAPVYRAVERQGLPVTVAYASDQGIEGYTDREFGVSFNWDTDLLSGYTPRFLTRLGRGGRSASSAPSLTDLRGVIRDSAPGALLATGYTGAYHRAALIAALGARLPLLFRAETTDHALVRGGARRWARDGALRLLYSRCNKLLYIGQRSRAHYVRLGCRSDKLVFAPYCVSLESFQTSEEARSRLREEVRTELGISNDRRVVMFSGKLSRRKAPRTLIDAIAGMPTEVRARWTVLYVGAGELRPSLEMHGTDVDVRFVGFQSQHRLSRYFHAADVFALPSTEAETWGLVVNEALHHGVPVIASSAVGCVPDLVIPGACGEIFPAGSSHEMRHALARLMRWHTETRATRDGCRAAVEGYTIDEAARGIVAGYESARRGTRAWN